MRDPFFAAMLEPQIGDKNLGQFDRGWLLHFKSLSIIIQSFKLIYICMGRFKGYFSELITNFGKGVAYENLMWLA